MDKRKNLKRILIGLLVGLFIVIIFFSFKPIRKFFMEREKVAEIYTGKNALYSEEWFERQYQEIEKQKNDIKTTKEEMKTNNSESLKNSYYAQIKIVNSLISEYNAKMRSSKYQEFANKGLPREIELVEVE
ncbi:MAG: hypothetical protein Q4A42_02870 [Tissierellia bacterium]|nr:hypothetical protein [Tissierellia bacterium]